MGLFKIDAPEARTAGEIFAAHCASYINRIEHELGPRTISLGASDGAPIGLYTPAQLTSLGGALHITGARFMCDLAELLDRTEKMAARGVIYDACHSVYDLTLERTVK